MQGSVMLLACVRLPLLGVIGRPRAASPDESAYQYPVATQISRWHLATYLYCELLAGSKILLDFSLRYTYESNCQNESEKHYKAMYSALRCSRHSSPGFGNHALAQERSRVIAVMMRRALVVCVSSSTMLRTMTYIFSISFLTSRKATSPTQSGT